jgi:hypothetical protein
VSIACQGVSGERRGSSCKRMMVEEVLEWERGMEVEREGRVWYSYLMALREDDVRCL